MKSITAVSFALAIAGCSSSTLTSPQTGTLRITVSEPTGLAGAVTVTGPGGFHQTIGATQSLGVPPGTYTVTAAGVKSSDSIVGTVYTSSVTGSPAVVSLATTTTATVTYDPRQGTGGLWISGANLFGSSSEFNTTVEIPAAGLKSSGQADFIATLGFGTMPFNTIDDANLAFDGAGNLWVVNIIENTAVEYPVSELAMTTGLATPGVTIHLPGQGVPSGMAFDASGNLWVANDNGNLLWELSPDQLTASGSPTPAVTITESVSGQGPTGLAFDAHGNLWVANGLANNLIAYTPSQLAQTGTPAPTVTITGPSLIGPTYMAFDKSGN
ncbi:MAG TPA: hypothetical protein VK679_18245, partial [Gemmatimonadaceae bacterium]|nr:hypothetical protein [Gemmatimonadaceae bacterium]